MINLLKETSDFLKEHGKFPCDVLWVGNGKISFSWEQFAKIADFDYDNGFGAVHISLSLVIVGEDWWIERHEYDGLENWEFKTYPLRPKKCLGEPTRKDIDEP